jgi:uncharacterized Zn-binding protein involved in type VI secretion
MGAPAAAKGGQVMAVDIHIVLVPSPAGTIPTPLPHTFTGKLDGNLVSSVKIGGQPAATVGSTATNQPSHIATPPGTSFQSPPSDKGTVKVGSATVKIGGQAAARMGDTAETCNDPSDLPGGTVIASGTVMIG